MTIEERCDKILSNSNGTFASSIQDWTWRGYPKFSYMNYPRPRIALIHKLIEDADIAECLLSPNQYIRECKKYLLIPKSRRYL